MSTNVIPVPDHVEQALEVSRRVALALMLAVVAVGVLCPSAQSQQVPQLEGALGGMTLPRVLGDSIESRGEKLRAAREGWQYSVIPAYISADTASLTGATFQAAYNRFEMAARYLRLDPDGAGALDQIRGQAKYKLRDTGGGFKLAAVGAFTDLENSHDQVDLGFSASQKLSEHLALAAFLRWTDRDRDDGTSVSDLGGTVGFTASLATRVLFGADYTFENDVSNDDDYSGTFTILLPGGNKALVLGGSKGDVFYAFFSLGL